MYTWLLQFWARDYYDYKNYRLFALLTVSICLVGSFSYIFKSYIILTGSLRVSKLLSFKMSFSLMHASINNFFDRIPIGRILNRFLRDMNDIDINLGYTTQYLLTLCFTTIVDLVVAVLASSVLVVPFIMVFVVASIKVQLYYMNTAREITRLRSISTSPAIQAFSEGMQGGAFIRAFDRQAYSIDLYSKSLEVFQINCLIKDALFRWFAVRLALLSALVLLPSIILNLLYVRAGAGIFAMLMRYMLTLITDVSDFLDCISNAENCLVSFERCSHFVEIQSEQGYKNLPKLQNLILRNETPLYIQENWPKHGLVEIRDLKVRYRVGLNYVIKGISLDIPAGCKVGIVGRTGAGKTTFLSCLYRQIDDYEGSVTIDGVEIRDIDLKDLRSSISIIPQEPYLFQDTLRNNIDPLCQRTENEIIKTLSEVGLWIKFKTKKGLDTKIERDGSNLSQGEKQLICLSRALLFQKKVILMDEATANIDPESESSIQRLIKERFVGCTLIMIAHRLNTVLQCDKILVLDKGQVLEFEDLDKLKSDPSSHFYKLLAKHNEIENALR